jgi:hypothetical protein
MNIYIRRQDPGHQGRESRSGTLAGANNIVVVL